MNNSKPKITPALPRGMRDLLPDQLAVRYKVIETLRRVFELYGFQPLETPAMERLEILSGKGGEESDKLSFLVMKRGADLERALEKVKSGSASPMELVDSGLRFELTVSLARVVAQYPGKLSLPFKRYQIAPVWRAERPQHGRYREFTQCDIDIVGTDSPFADAEIASIYADVYSSLGLDVEIVINDRRLLSALSKASGNRPDQFTAFCTALDKLDKIGWDEVTREMGERGLDTTKVSKLIEACDQRFQLDDSKSLHDQKLLVSFIDDDPLIEELSAFHALLNNLGVSKRARVFFDPTLARGLDYYTGFVVEAKLASGGVGSLGGGGRYDGLVEAFSKESYPAVGASFGLDRIVDVLSQNGVATVGTMSLSIIFSKGFSAESSKYVTEAIALLRTAGIPCEIGYQSENKLGKQIQAAVKRGNAYVLILGEQEDDQFDIKRLTDGEQRRLTLPQIVGWIKESAK